MFWKQWKIFYYGVNAMTITNPSGIKNASELNSMLQQTQI